MPTTQFTTPGCSTYAVPTGVKQVAINAFGGKGGGLLGGLGGEASGLLNVSLGQTLDVCVGVGGGITGGADENGGYGGGASDVRTGAFQLTDRVIVAGGGGGGGLDGTNAGAGGGPSGTDCTSVDLFCGSGGTQVTGGVSGQSGTFNNGTQIAGSGGVPAALGVGGSGGGGTSISGFISTSYSAGGGGGGYYGGGGGSLWGGGGGGSGYVAPSIQANGGSTNTAGVHSGNGEVDITPTKVGLTITTTSLPVATRGAIFGPVTLTTVDVDPSASPFVTTLKWHKVSPLPKGLKLSGAGVLSGTPSLKMVDGSTSITVSATEKVTTLFGSKKIKTLTTVQATIPLTIQG
jgi:hypothetical protein